jgi:hypothetical protein
LRKSRDTDMREAAPPDVQILERDGYLEARYLGAYSIERYHRQMERSVQACKELGLELLLVDITDLTDFRPTIFERHDIGTLGATLSRGLEKVAVLLALVRIEPDHFATLVAQNRGLRIQSFSDRAKAIEWLLPGNPVKR